MGDEADFELDRLIDEWVRDEDGEWLDGPDDGGPGAYYYRSPPRKNWWKTTPRQDFKGVDDLEPVDVVKFTEDFMTASPPRTKT